MTDAPRTYTAFTGDHQLATGRLPTVLLEAKARLDANPGDPLLIFEDDTGRQVDFDFRGSADAVLARAAPKPGPGRPRLGVVSRELSLLPRHWAWLEAQPSGISAAVRRLVEEASKRDPEKQAMRRQIDATSRVMTALGGNLPGYEEASRALFAGDRKRFKALIRPWPTDIRKHLERLLSGAAG